MSPKHLPNTPRPYQKSQYDPLALGSMIRYARGLEPCDLVIKGSQWLDVFQGKWQKGDLAIAAGTIVGVGESYVGKQVVDGSGFWVVPGFIDSHVHIESSLMTPRRFSETVLPRGTTTVIWDPHEIANVWGVQGIQWALDQSEPGPEILLSIFIMAPSCVPSTSQSLGLETSGADLRAQDLRGFRDHPRVLGLAEMMNYPGLLGGDPDVLTKLEDFAALPRDGHCPGLSGKDLNAYGVAGIHTCHESTTLGEAQEKLSKGIHVLLREGSCAKNASTLLPLLSDYSSAVLGFCSDDRNPLDIETEGHIDRIINLALMGGHGPAAVFRAASYGAARMYQLLDRGALAPGYRADLVCVAPKITTKGEPDWTSGIQIQKVLKGGQWIQPKSSAAPLVPVPKPPSAQTNLNIHTQFRGESLKDFLRIPTSDQDAPGSPVQVRVIGVIPQQIVTKSLTKTLVVTSLHTIEADLSQDILKIMVIERHHKTKSRGIGLVHGFGLKRGAIATSINHDSHNALLVGSSDHLMLMAWERLLDMDGGIVVVHESGEVAHLPLPYGGLMTDEPPGQVSEALRRLKSLAQRAGCVLEEPFLQLSFLALPVIGNLKITDQGLVDVTNMKVVPLRVNEGPGKVP